MESSSMPLCSKWMEAGEASSEATRIIAMAFQTNKTRVATLLLCRDLSGLFYPFLNVRTAHHPTSHEDHSDAYERVTRYYVSQLSYLAGSLAAMQEAETNVFANSCMML